jgi:hypothetical protein
MAEDGEGVEGVLATEIAPPSRPRDSGGKFINETRAPEHILQFREPGLEGRPPKVKGRVANDVVETAPRSAMMPMPTTDTTYSKVSRKIFPQSQNLTPKLVKAATTSLKKAMTARGTKSPSMVRGPKSR